MIRWRPDTCGCVLSVDPTLTVCHQADPCPAHSTHTPATILHAILDENRHKNSVEQAIENDPELGEEVVSESGERTRRIRSGVRFEWAFDLDRQLTVRVTGASAEARARVGRAVNGRAGQRRVTLG